MLWTVMLETLESPLDCKEIQPVRPKGNQSWIFTGRTDTEAETPILWPPDVKNWRTESLEKTLMLGKIEGKRRGQQRMRRLHGITNLMDMSLSWLDWNVLRETQQGQGLRRAGADTQRACRRLRGLGGREGGPEREDPGDVCGRYRGLRMVETESWQNTA